MYIHIELEWFAWMVRASRRLRRNFYMAVTTIYGFAPLEFRLFRLGPVGSHMERRLQDGQCDHRKNRTPRNHSEPP